MIFFDSLKKFESIQAQHFSDDEAFKGKNLCGVKKMIFIVSITCKSSKELL